MSKPMMCERLHIYVDPLGFFHITHASESESMMSSSHECFFMSRNAPYHPLLLDGSPKGEPIYIIHPKQPHNQSGGGRALCGNNKILRVFW